MDAPRVGCSLIQTDHLLSSLGGTIRQHFAHHHRRLCWEGVHHPGKIISCFTIIHYWKQLDWSEMNDKCTYTLIFMYIKHKLWTKKKNIYIYQYISTYIYIYLLADWIIFNCFKGYWRMPLICWILPLCSTGGCQGHRDRNMEWLERCCACYTLDWRADYFHNRSRHSHR